MIIYIVVILSNWFNSIQYPICFISFDFTYSICLSVYSIAKYFHICKNIFSLIDLWRYFPQIKYTTSFKLCYVALFTNIFHIVIIQLLRLDNEQKPLKLLMQTQIKKSAFSKSFHFIYKTRKVSDITKNHLAAIETILIKLFIFAREFLIQIPVV